MKVLNLKNGYAIKPEDENWFAGKVIATQEPPTPKGGVKPNKMN